MKIQKVDILVIGREIANIIAAIKAKELRSNGAIVIKNYLLQIIFLDFISSIGLS